MFVVAEDRQICALCKYWCGNGNLEFVFGNKIKIHQDSTPSLCRERQTRTLAMNSCRNFQRKADL